MKQQINVVKFPYLLVEASMSWLKLKLAITLYSAHSEVIKTGKTTICTNLDVLGSGSCQLRATFKPNASDDLTEAKPKLTLKFTPRVSRERAGQLGVDQILSKPMTRVFDACFTDQNLYAHSEWDDSGFRWRDSETEDLFSTSGVVNIMNGSCSANATGVKAEKRPIGEWLDTELRSRRARGDVSDLRYVTNLKRYYIVLSRELMNWGRETPPFGCESEHRQKVREMGEEFYRFSGEGADSLATLHRLVTHHADATASRELAVIWDGIGDWKA
jgi:hypothetical protein